MGAPAEVIAEPIAESPTKAMSSGPAFCAALCQFCAVEFFALGRNPSRNSSNTLAGFRFSQQALGMAEKE
jgi:hypothetical protein